MTPPAILRDLAAALREGGAASAWADATRRDAIVWRRSSGPVHVAHARVLHSIQGIVRIAIDSEPARMSSRARTTLGMRVLRTPQGAPRAQDHEPDYDDAGELSCLTTELDRVIPWLARLTLARDEAQAMPPPPVAMCSSPPVWSYDWTSDAWAALDAKQRDEVSRRLAGA